MASHLLLHTAPCGVWHCQPSPSGRQAPGAVPVAPPPQLGSPSASLHPLSRRGLLTARRPPKQAVHLLTGCGSSGSRRRRRSHSTAELLCQASAGVCQPDEVSCSLPGRTHLSCFPPGVLEAGACRKSGVFICCCLGAVQCSNEHIPTPSEVVSTDCTYGPDRRKEAGAAGTICP